MISQDSKCAYLFRFVAVILLLFLSLSSQTSAESIKIAVFDLQLVDTSDEGKTREIRGRLQRASEQLRNMLGESGQFTVVDLAPAAKQIEEAGDLNFCNGCERDIARDLGADVALIGTVRKVSYLILNIVVLVTDVSTGKPLVMRNIGLHGDDDDQWRRGISYLVRHYLLEE